MEGQKKTRNKSRNSKDLLFSKKKMKILFAIACINENEVITQRELSSVLNLRYTTLCSQITKLKQHGLINRKNHLTNDGLEVLQFFNHWDKTFTKKIRAHKIQISINLISLPSNFFNLKHKVLKPFSNNKYNGLKGIIQGIQVLFYSSKKLMLILPNVYGNNDSEILGAIHSTIEKVQKELIKQFKGIKLGEYEVCKFTSMHCAIVNSIIAESYLLKKGCCFSSDSVCVDNSHGNPELESENLENMFENLDIMITAEQLQQENTEMKKILWQLSQNFKNIGDDTTYKNIKTLLLKISKNDNNSMPNLQEKTSIHTESGVLSL